MNDNVKECPEQYRAVMNTPHQQIVEHLRHLDQSLKTIDNWSDEGIATRRYVVGQIDALKWAMRLLEV